jgi:hypothetical protein
VESNRRLVLHYRVADFELLLPFLYLLGIGETRNLHVLLEVMDFRLGWESIDV